ncbi:unnamed protein product [Dicrocoelium dendriticum]|nr:unnamed protein product [Dicrocoelium dendriticum]
MDCGSHTQKVNDERRSLLSFICPRLLSFGTADNFRISLISRNLLSEFEACDTSVLSGNELMKVFLRLKPFMQSGQDLDDKPVLKYVNKHTVTANPPGTRRLGIRESRRTNHRFTFSQVFDSAATQSSVFSVVAVDQIRGFLEGLNGLIFAYGTTGSGKTYTMQGCLRDMGLIPRTLCVLFRSVKNSMNPSLLPKDFSDVTNLSPAEVEKLLRDKAALLKLGNHVLEDSFGIEDGDLESVSQLTIFGSNASNVSADTPYASVPNGCITQPLRSTNDLRFTFWISFAEIYNELVYDLLDPSQCMIVTQLGSSNRPGGVPVQQKNIFSTVPGHSGLADLNSHRLRRKSLDLRTDKNGNVFIKGLNVFPLSSPEEALRLILVGRQFQRVAATRLNEASSRSHTILTIKAVRVVDKDNPKFARISSLTFCDLAGSERSEKAETGGQAARLREAGTINTSLLTLGRCIECLRYNQSHPDNPRLVPYRDSKLTRLFQGFFTGRGKACMIVNASPNPELFDETLHALRFSALATRIIVHSNSIVDTFVQPGPDGDLGVNEKPKSQFRSSPTPDLSSPPGNNSVIQTPPTVVPKATVVRVRHSSVPEAQQRLLASEADQSGLLDETKVELSVGSGTILGSSTTPTTTENVDIALEQFTKQELISMVRELSEQLFDSKAEVVEQQSRFRDEMCEAMNRQLVEFERLYEESWNAQEKLILEQSKRRRKQYEELATDQSDRSSQKRKRFRQDDSVGSNGDGAAMNESCFTEPHEASNGHRHSEHVTQLREHIRDLEGELADHRDAIELLSRERDQLRLDVTRLEFANSHLQKTLDTSRTENSQRAFSEAASQTELLRPVEATFSSAHAQDSTGASTTEDCQMVLHLTQLQNPIQLRQSDHLDADAQVQRLREENQQLLTKLADVRGCIQQAIEEKRAVELELTQLQCNLSVDDGEYTRFTQIEEVSKLRRELAESNASHQAVLHATEARCIAERNEALRSLREDLESDLRTQQELVAALKARVPERHVSVQTTTLPQASVDIFVQTVSPAKLQSSDASIQVLFQNTSVGSQTVSPTPASALPSHFPNLIGAFGRSLTHSGRLEATNSDTERTIENTIISSYHRKRKLCLRRRKSRSKNPQKLPSPVRAPQFISDSDSDGEKENRDGSNASKEDMVRSTSEPIRSARTRTTSRQVRGTICNETPYETKNSSIKVRHTRSAVATRRLPPLAESTQLLADSFFQDDIDAALEQLDSDSKVVNTRRQLRASVRQLTRKRR